ncbi:creatininase family protein [Parvibaculum sp.]|uniref:creatininase family protein n=1 Tax=Parvibaculum sp. TaxID=2024848 RepID=UPI0038B3F3C7
MLLHHSSWPEIEAYLEKSRGIVIPVGSTEQHGPSGLIGTDAICPEAIASRAGAEAGFLVGPTFNVGIAQHHLAFPGTMTLRPSTMIAAIHDWVSSLSRHGFERIYFFNGHGGNVATIEAAFSEIYADRSLGAAASNRGPVKCRRANWWDFKPVMAFCQQRYGSAHGVHATPSEIAVTQFLHPHAIKDIGMSPKVAPWGRYTDAESYRAAFPDGRIGSDPSLADPADGEKLIALSVEGLIADFRKFEAA